MNPLPRWLRSGLALLATGHSVAAQSPNALDWVLDPNPPSRAGAVFAFHAASGAVVQFGGGDYEPINDTWVWRDGWRRIEPANRPSPRRGVGLTYDSLRARLVLFGGSDRTTVFGDTWVFDGANWMELAPAASPAPRWNGPLVYDSARDRVVLRGGDLATGGGWSTELWEFDGTTWQLRPQAGDVPGSYGYFVFDAARGETLAMHSTGLRAWNGSQWSMRSTLGLPAPLPYGQMLFDPAGSRVLLMNPNGPNGRTDAVYSFDGQSWTLVTQAPLAATYWVSMVMDTRHGRVLGWHVRNNSGVADQLSDTWLFDGSSWAKVQQGLPPSRTRAAMAFDSVRGRVVMHSGLYGNAHRYDTYELNGRNWWLGAEPVSSSLEVAHHRLVFDEARVVCWLFGGDDPLQNHIAGWDGQSWTISAPAVRPPARRDPAMCYDRVRGATLVFGGAGSTGVLGDFWSWNGTAWTSLAPATMPSPRRAATMSFDGARGCTVLFGGTDGAILFSDTWEFAGLDWSPCATTSAPPARHGHVQVYDTTRQRTVVYGGASATGALRDTWTWDGVAWSPLVTAHRPDAGEGVCAAYDADRQEVVLFGGDGTRGELWRLRDPGLGTWLPQGTGCSTGYGDLTLTAINNAAIASVMQFRVDHLPSHFALLASVWFGFDDQQWNGAPLPASLAVAGAPACYVRLDPQVPTWAANAGTGHASSSIVVPNLPPFVGMQIFAQAVAWDLLTGTVTTSNSLAARLRGY